MTQRSIQSSPTPTVIIRAGGAVQIEGQASERVLASTEHRAGMKVERHGTMIEIHIGGSGEVSVPLGSSLKVYAGQSAAVRQIGGSVTLYAGVNGYLRDVDTLVHASAGGELDIACERIAGNDLQCTAGRDLRFFVRQLRDARLLVKDIGGSWEGVVGNGRARIRLKAGGDVIVVTDQEVMSQPPQYVLGSIERPESVQRKT